jgi:hypothetical protein
MTGAVQQLKEMGFSEEQSRQALAECVWDVNKALDLLFTRGTAPLGACEGVGKGDSSPSLVDESVRPQEDKGSGTGSAVLSPVAARKARIADGVATVSGGGSPGGVDSAEQSTTASTASSPRSSGCIDKPEKSASASAPLSPQSAGVSVEVVAEEDEEEIHVQPVVEDEASPTEDASAQAPSTEPPAADSKLEHSAEVFESSPTKRLTRVSRAWEMESADAQLCVKEGDFVSVWQSTVTEHGWIYAEDVTDSTRAGWLPGCVLEELESSQRWMKAAQSMEATHETQLSTSEGSYYKVSINTRTNEGWAYAEGFVESTSGSSGEDSQSAVQAGWVPVFCLEWAEE